MDFRNDIQGLRAIAVLFVLIFHTNSNWLPGGFIGVDIFFVISGYLISSIILQKKDENSFSILSFYISRIKRIVPAYYILLIFIAVVSGFLCVGRDIDGIQQSLTKAFLFISNIHFADLDTYFGAKNSENPLLHTWTLAIEMQYYLFLPIILLLIKKKWLLSFITGITILLFTYGTYEVFFNQNKGEMYFSLLARIPEFMVGVLANLVSKKVTINAISGIILSIISLFLMLFSAYAINETSQFPGIIALIPCFGAAVFLSLPNNPINTFISNAVFSFIGKLSYSIYLWHWPILAFFRYKYNTYHLSPYQIIVAIILISIFSLISYYYIEQFFRKEKGRKFWISLSAISCLNILLIFIISPLNKDRKDIPIEYSSPIFGMNSHGTLFKFIETFGDTINANNKNILLIGDSHALCMKPYFDYLGKQHSFSFRTITNSNYPLIPGIPETEFTKKKIYNTYIDLLAKSETEINRSDIIFFSCYGNGEEWIEQIRSLLNNLKPNQFFVYIQDYPSLDINPVRVNRNFIKNKNLKNNYQLLHHQLSHKTQELISNYNNACYLTLSEEIFKTAPFHNDTLMYFDQNHLNIYGAIIYAKSTEKQFINFLDSISLQN